MEENSITWKLVNLFWVLFSFIFLLNGIGIIYAGWKSDNRNWLMEGIVYQIFPTALLLLAMINPNSSVGVTLAGIYILTWIVCIIRTFFIAGKYLNYMRNKNGNLYNSQQPNSYNYQRQFNNQKYPNDMNMQFSNRPPYDNRQNPDFEGNTINDKKDIPVELNNHNNYNQANSIQNTIPSMDNSMSFEEDKQNTLNNSSNNIPSVDINTATIDEILLLPSMDVKQAEKIIELRNRGVMISSLDDFKQKLDLTDYEVNQMKDHIIISSTARRRIDL